MKLGFLKAAVVLVALVFPTAGSTAEWKPVEGRIMTRWAKSVTVDNAWKEYPRPQLVRSLWMNLNGLWDYAIEGEPGEWKQGRVENAKSDPLTRLGRNAPSKWDGRILAPFCIESALSGVGELVRPNQSLWYRRSFEVPSQWEGKRVRLNFQAVDWHAIVFVNGKRVGENRGGYVPFGFDITDALKPAGRQEVVVAVWDPTNTGNQTIGKQSLPELRKGFRYTPTTGIWQTVWLEPVSEASIERLKIVPDVDNQQVRVTVLTRGDTSGVSVEVTAWDGSQKVAVGSGNPGGQIDLKISSPKLWSPDRPFLYDLKVSLNRGGEAIDVIESYFGMRKIALGKDEHGVTRVFLNNQLLRFQFGPLDQGYWPDGILTPPSDEAAEFDVQYLKDIACNMIRPHIKIHPDRWYYHCDRLGLLVWQDMICTRRFDQKITPESAKQWETEQRRMIDHLHNHPSVTQWIVFNEGWGQYDTERLTTWTKKYDPTRLVTCASGWADVAGAGDIRDIHDYSFYPSISLPEVEKDRAIVIGEFGGFNVPAPRHQWHPDQLVEPHSDPLRESSRESYANGKEWLQHYEKWIRAWRYLIGEHGLCGGVYTQITDVEHELNGWLTYDREVSKIDVADLRRLHQSLYESPPRPGPVLLPNSKSDPQIWRYITSEPASDWPNVRFDDAVWKAGPGPFGNTGTGARFAAERIYLRRTFRLDRVPRHAAIRLYSRGTVDVYLNGELASSVVMRGTRDSIGVSILPLQPETVATLQVGENLVAVRAEMDGETKFVDVGLVELPE